MAAKTRNKIVHKAVEILNSKKINVIATADKEGQPWNTPVAGFRFKGDLDFYWTSHKNSRHSTNIRENSKVFIVVFNEETAKGVYFLAEAHEIKDEQEAVEAAKVFVNDKYNSSDGMEYLGDKPRRIYKAVSSKAWMNADKTDKSGKFLHDYRVEVDIEALKANIH